jgi:hypothetical protein
VSGVQPEDSLTLPRRGSLLFRWRVAIFVSKRDSWRAKLTAYTLAGYMDNETATCDPGIAAVALHAGVGRDTIKRGVAELERHGYLVVWRQRGRMTEHGRTNIYRAVMPDWVERDESEGGACSATNLR